MRFYTIRVKNERKTAVSIDGSTGVFLEDLGYDVRDLHDLIEISDRDLPEEIKQQLSAIDAKALPHFELAKAELAAPIPVPHQDVICLGVNYDEHLEETKSVIDFSDKPATVYFSKRVNEATGDGGEIADYDFVDSLDYEVELGVILGKDARGVSAKDAMDYVFGYTIINDFSARNVQMRHQQWYLGKSLDTYTAMGPCIVTADEIADVHDLRISCMVNGELRQSSNTKFMVQSVDRAIEELSAGMTLKAGTIIATGTPGGVGMGIQPPAYLKSQDVVICEIEKIGKLTNYIA